MVETERMVGNWDAPPAKVGDGLIIVVSDSDIHRAARLHLERHGNEAVAKARDMVRNLKEGGDNEAADTWLRIIVAIEVFAARVGNMMGELVMEALATLDQVAFNRSGSFYRNFREPRISANSSAK